MMESYIESHCKHQDLFQSDFQQSWLDARFVKALELLRANSPLQALLDESLLSEIYPNVFSLPVFTTAICNVIIEETEHFLEYAKTHDIAVHRPNSMVLYSCDMQRSCVCLFFTCKL